MSRPVSRWDAVWDSVLGTYVTATVPDAQTGTYTTDAFPFPLSPEPSQPQHTSNNDVFPFPVYNEQDYDTPMTTTSSAPLPPPAPTINNPFYNYHQGIDTQETPTRRRHRSEASQEEAKAGRERAKRQRTDELDDLKQYSVAPSTALPISPMLAATVAERMMGTGLISFQPASITTPFIARMTASFLDDIPTLAAFMSVSRHMPRALTTAPVTALGDDRTWSLFYNELWPEVDEDEEEKKDPEDRLKPVHYPRLPLYFAERVVQLKTRLVNEQTHMALKRIAHQPLDVLEAMNRLEDVELDLSSIQNYQYMLPYYKDTAKMFFAAIYNTGYQKLRIFGLKTNGYMLLIEWGFPLPPSCTKLQIELSDVAGDRSAEFGYSMSSSGFNNYQLNHSSYFQYITEFIWLGCKLGYGSHSDWNDTLYRFLLSLHSHLKKLCIIYNSNQSGIFMLLGRFIDGNSGGYFPVIHSVSIRARGVNLEPLTHVFRHATVLEATIIDSSAPVALVRMPNLTTLTLVCTQTPVFAVDADGVWGAVRVKSLVQQFFPVLKVLSYAVLRPVSDEYLQTSVRTMVPDAITGINHWFTLIQLEYSTDSIYIENEDGELEDDPRSIERDPFYEQDDNSANFGLNFSHPAWPAEPDSDDEDDDSTVPEEEKKEPEHPIWPVLNGLEQNVTRAITERSYTILLPLIFQSRHRLNEHIETIQRVVVQVDTVLDSVEWTFAPQRNTATRFERIYESILRMRLRRYRSACLVRIDDIIKILRALDTPHLNDVLDEHTAADDWNPSWLHAEIPHEVIALYRRIIDNKQERVDTSTPPWLQLRWRLRRFPNWKAPRFTYLSPVFDNFTLDQCVVGIPHHKELIANLEASTAEPSELFGGSLIETMRYNLYGYQEQLALLKWSRLQYTVDDELGDVELDDLIDRELQFRAYCNYYLTTAIDTDTYTLNIINLLHLVHNARYPRVREVIHRLEILNNAMPQSIAFLSVMRLDPEISDVLDDYMHNPSSHYTVPDSAQTEVTVTQYKDLVKEVNLHERNVFTTLREAITRAVYFFRVTIRVSEERLNDCLQLDGDDMIRLDILNHVVIIELERAIYNAAKAKDAQRRMSHKWSINHSKR